MLTVLFEIHPFIRGSGPKHNIKTETNYVPQIDTLPLGSKTLVEVSFNKVKIYDATFKEGLEVTLAEVIIELYV